jgi:hypothetical protein
MIRLDLLQHSGIIRVQMLKHTIVYHTDPKVKQALQEDDKRLFRSILPFLRRWIKLPGDYEETYQQMIDEMQDSNFEMTSTIFTTWGIKRSTAM